MQPKEIVKLYTLLCTKCRYDWIYKNRLPTCITCNNKRLTTSFIYLNTLKQIDFFEDYKNNLLHVKITDSWSINQQPKNKSRVLAIFTHELPAKQELFETFVYRSDFIFGRFFTKSRFVGTTLPKYNLRYTNVFFFTI